MHDSYLEINSKCVPRPHEETIRPGRIPSTSVKVHRLDAGSARSQTPPVLGRACHLAGDSLDH
jgi:hypothetical protein